MKSIEICAGAGGQALGLEQAGFDHIALVEIDSSACQTLRKNRPNWRVFEDDVKGFSAKVYKGEIDLLAGGVPCPPFSIAGKQLGHEDERDLFPEALRLVSECRPKAVMLENVRGLLDPKFAAYRNKIKKHLNALGYIGDWQLLQASDFGVPQLRPRAIFVGLRRKYIPYFKWPKGNPNKTPTVGSALHDEMASAGWRLADQWASTANDIAPTLVGGSKKHGGADLGPSRAKSAWEKLGVDGNGLADFPPAPDFVGMPKLTVKMASIIQGFPPEWTFVGRKTPAYRQVGNAFPPPVAKAVGIAIRRAIELGDEIDESEEEDTKMPRGNGARNKLREYFLAHVGEVLDSDTLREVAGISEWARRVRELRNEEGYQIMTDKDLSDLKPGQYILTTPTPVVAYARKISKETRSFVLDRDGYTCQMCGAVAGEPHPFDPTRKTVLTMGHIVDKSMGGTDDPSNLRAICSICNEGASNITLERPSYEKLLIQVRRASNGDQLKVLEWLIKKYPKESKTLM